MRVWDAAGREYLDAVSGGVWTVNVGYGRETIADAVRDQLVRMNYFANSAGSVPGALFAQKLIGKMPGNEPRLLFEFRLGGQREGVQDGAPDRTQAPWRPQAQDSLPRTRLSRHHARHALGRRPAAARRPVRPADARLRGSPALPRIPLAIRRGRKLRRDGGRRHRGGDPARGTGHDRRALPGADHGGRRRHHPAPGLLGARAGHLPTPRHPAAHRRSGLRASGAPENGSATSITA